MTQGVTRTKLAARVAVASAALLFMLAAAAYALTTGILMPVSDGFYKQWVTSSGSSTHFTHVDETPCNGTTDFVRTTVVGNRDSFGIDLASVPNSSGATTTVITRIDIKPCASRHNSGGGSSVMNVFYRWNGVDSSGTGSYALTGTTPTEQATSTYSGLALVKDGSSTLEVGAALFSGNRGARLSRISTQLTYVSTPLAPTNLTVTKSGSTTAILNWIDRSSDEDGFKVERSPSGCGSFAEIAIKPVNSASHTDSGLPAGSYCWRVRAFNAAGNSAYTNVATATLP